MEIAIDCRMFNDSGVGTCIRELLPFMLDSCNEFVLLGKESDLAQYGDKAKIIDCGITPFSFREMLAFPVEMINECDVFYTPFFNIPAGIKIPVCCTIHDVVFLDVPGLVSPFGKLIRRMFLRRAVNVSSRIFTVSEFSKKRIAAHFDCGDRIDVVKNGVPSDIDRTPVDSPENVPYFLYIGNMKKHKGLDILLDAFEQTLNVSDKHSLVIIGQIDGLRSSDSGMLKRFESFGEKVKILGKTDRKTLIRYLKSADALVQPSRYEGFGIPPMEALAAGVPAILSDIEVFREIYSDLPVVFFKDGDPVSLAEVMTRDKFLKSSVNIADMFSWRNSALRILDILGNVTAGRA